METIVAAKHIEIEELDFKPLTKSSIEEINALIAKYPSRSCDYSIGGIFMWIDYFQYKFAISEDSLFIMGNENGTPFFYRPIGRLSESASYTLIYDYCKANGIFPRILGEETISADTPMQALNPLEYKREWMEYLYDIDKFIGFPGKKMEKKRNHYNYFIKNYPDAKLIPISSDMYNALKDFTESFEDNHGGDGTFEYESTQTLDVLRNFEQYPFIGYAVEIDNKIVGYTFGEIIGDTLFAHVEKGDIEIRGIYQILASSLCKNAKNRFPELRFVNREEDMGYEALAKSKMSYHPTAFIMKHIE